MFHLGACHQQALFLSPFDAYATHRFLAEIGLCLERAGYDVEQEKNGLLPVSWNGASLCRVNAQGGVQFRTGELDPEGAEEAFHRVLDLVLPTAEYLRLMETAPPLQAKGLDGDYRLLADFNGAVLAGHPTEYGVQFVTWEWDYEHSGMWQGHYYGANYAEAKKDFAVRAKLLPHSLLFDAEQLEDLYRCCQKTRELDDTLDYHGEQRIIRTQEHIEDICPGVRERIEATELDRQESKYELEAEDPAEQFQKEQGMQMGGMSC